MIFGPPPTAKILRIISKRSSASRAGCDCPLGQAALASRMRWIAREHQFEDTRPMVVMGIVNFAGLVLDGGQFLDVDAAVTHALRLANEGAEILDIGGESTRPGAGGERAGGTGPCHPSHPALGQATGWFSPLTLTSYACPLASAGAAIVNDIAANRS